VARLPNTLRVSSVEDFVRRFAERAEIAVVEGRSERVQKLAGGKEEVFGVFFEAQGVVWVRKFAECSSVGEFYAVLLHEIGHAALSIPVVRGKIGVLKGPEEERVADSFAETLMARFGLVVPEWFGEIMRDHAKALRSSGRADRALEAGRGLAERVWEWVSDER